MHGWLVKPFTVGFGKWRWTEASDWRGTDSLSKKGSLDPGTVTSQLRVQDFWKLNKVLSHANSKGGRRLFSSV